MNNSETMPKTTAQSSIHAFIQAAKEYAAQNPRPKRTEPMTAAERDAVNRRIIEKLDQLGMIRHDDDAKAGDSE